jgi:fibronectin-binding autotransporter adhesin
MPNSFSPREVLRARRPFLSLFRRFVLLAAALLVTGLLEPPVHAGTTDSWLGGVGSWTAMNWSIMTPPGYPTNSPPPGPTYNAVIGVPGSDVSLGIGVSLDNLSIAGGDTLEVTSSGGPTIKTYAGAGTLSNAGMIDLFGGSSLGFDGSGVPGIPMATLSGGGTVMLSGGSIGGTAGPTSPVTLTTDNFIMGAGVIGGMNLINHGTIDASFPMATLSINPAGTTGTVKNVGTGAPMSGLLEATGGGTLALGIGTFDNTDPTHPGVISAGAGSKITLGSTLGGLTTIKGGTLSSLAGDPGSFITTVPPGVVTLNGVTLAPGTKYGQADFAHTNLEGTITNGGSISLSSSGMGLSDTSVLALDSGDVTLSGTGTIAMLGVATGIPTMPNLVQIQGFGAARLTIGAGQTIMGSGQIGSHSTFLSPKLTNHGTITATTLMPGPGPAQGITIFPLILPAPPIADAVFNDGTMQALDNAFLTFNNGIVTNTIGGVGGMIAAHGHMMPSTLTLQESATINGGTILLDGPLSALQLNSGTARPDTLTNSSGGTITTVAPSTANTIGGAVTNSMGSFIKVADGSALTLDNAALGGSVTNSSIISVGTGAMGAGAATLTINQGSLTNFVGAVNGSIVVSPNGTLTLVGAGGVNSTINGGAVGISGAGGMIKLNEGTIHAGTLSNIADGLITTVNGSKSNRLGGIVHNPVRATIKVDTNSNLELETGGTYDNPGTILLNGGPPNLSILRPNGFGAGGNVSLTGGGSVVLGGDFVSNEISGVTGNERLVNVDNAISGGGKIGNLFGMISLTNKSTGTIQATAGTGITIEPNADGIINGGVIQTMGANLNLTKIAALGAAQGVFTNIDGATKGTIRAAFGNTVYLNGPAAANNAVIDNGFVQVIPGSTLQLSNGTIHNGTLTNFGAGSVIQTDPAIATTNTLGGTVNNNAGAVITVNAGSTLNLETGGTYINAGTINVNGAAGSNLSPSGANGTVTLDGGGAVNLLGAGSSIFGVAGTETLVNLNNTISGGGMIGAGKMALTNRSTINANNGGADLTIQPNAAGVTNSGTIQTGGGDLTLMGGNYTNFEAATDGLIRANNNDTITINGNAFIDGGNVDTVGGGTINLSNATIHNGTLTNNADGVILSTMNTTNTLGGTVNNLAGGLISVDHSTLKLETGGTYNNAGLLLINGGGAANPASLMLDGAGGTVTLSGGGTVTMSQAGGNSISGVNGNERLINLDNTINGVGQIGLGMMSLTNDGTIDANMVGPNMADGLGITITPNAGGVINGGILQGSNGAKLTLNGGIYTNTTGIIQALGMGSEVDLQNGVTINGGSLGSSSQSLIRVVDEAVLHTVTNNANLAQNEGSILDLIGTITNNGTIVMPATHFVTQIKLLSGDVTLGGTGSLVMQHSTLNQIIAANGLDRLTIGAGQTVRGTGDIGVGMLALTNNGKIIADQPTSLTIHPNAIGFTNTGTLQAAAGSTLNVIGGYKQTAGDTNVLGTLNVTAGPLTAAGGTLSGSGPSNISGGFSLTGTFTKLDSGTATISGPQSFSSGKTLAINGGIVKFNVTSGPVTVGSSVTVTVASGAQLELAGSVAALAAGSGRVDVVNSSAAPGVLVSGTNQQVGGIDGSGTTSINAGSDLTANHIIQTTLMIGGTAASAGAVTIAPSDASGEPLVPAAADGAGNGISGSLIKADDVLLSSDVPLGAPIAGGVALSFSDLALRDAAGVSGSPIAAGAFTPERNLVVGGTAVVPEPSAAALVGLAGLIWSIIGFRRRSSRLGASCVAHPD